MPSRPCASSAVRLVAALLVGALASAAIASPASAQYFGRNKVQYEKFDFRILRTQHFDVYFYPGRAPRGRRRGPHGRAVVRATLGSFRTASIGSRSSSTPTSRTSSRPTSSAGDRGGHGRRHRGAADPRRDAAPAGPTPTTTTCSATSWCTSSSTTSPERPGRLGAAARAAALAHRGHGGVLLARPRPLTAMWMRDAVRTRAGQPADDQAARRPALLPVPLRPGAVGVRRRTLGRRAGSASCCEPPAGSGASTRPFGAY